VRSGGFCGSHHFCCGPSAHKPSVTASDPADVPVVVLDGDGPASAKPSPLVGVAAVSAVASVMAPVVGVAAVTAVASVMALTVPLSSDMNSNTTGSFNVHTLRQSRRRGRNCYRANDSKCD
jgi:hypothetical protein